MHGSVNKQSSAADLPTRHSLEFRILNQDTSNPLLILVCSHKKAERLLIRA
jgi:hypothetical protein